MNDILRHHKGCAYSGSPVGPPHSKHDGRSCIPLSAQLCVCDPHGDKQRQHDLFLGRYKRRHVLWQREVWYQWDGAEIRITDMSVDRMKALVLFLERRAPRLKAAYESELVFAPGVQGEHALDAVDDILHETIEKDAVEWIRETPLMQRLNRRIRKRRKKELRREFA
jgi:hypothetical protein